MATTVKDLHNALKNGIVTFQYMKKNGTIRTAKGTTQTSTIEENYSFKGGEGPSRYGYTSYWDVEKGDWRCFAESRFIDILKVEEVDEAEA